MSKIKKKYGKHEAVRNREISKRHEKIYFPQLFLIIEILKWQNQWVDKAKINIKITE